MPSVLHLPVAFSFSLSTEHHCLYTFIFIHISCASSSSNNGGNSDLQQSFTIILLCQQVVFITVPNSKKVVRWLINHQPEAFILPSIKKSWTLFFERKYKSVSLALWTAVGEPLLLQIAFIETICPIL